MNGSSACGPSFVLYRNYVLNIEDTQERNILGQVCAFFNCSNNILIDPVTYTYTQISVIRALPEESKG